MAQAPQDAAIGAGLASASGQLQAAGRKLESWPYPGTVAGGSGLFLDPEYGLWSWPVEAVTVFTRPDDVAQIVTDGTTHLVATLSFANPDACRKMTVSGTVSAWLEIPAGTGASGRDDVHFCDLGVWCGPVPAAPLLDTLSIQDLHYNTVALSWREMAGVRVMPFWIAVDPGATGQVPVNVVADGNYPMPATLTCSYQVIGATAQGGQL